MLIYTLRIYLMNFSCNHYLQLLISMIDICVCTDRYGITDGVWAKRFCFEFCRLSGLDVNVCTK